MVKRISLPYTYTNPRTGIVYYRRAGRSLVSLGRPEDEGFLTAYEDAKRGRALVPTETTIASLITSYGQSSRFTERSPRTRADYLKVMDYLRGKIGQRDVAALTRPLVLEAMEMNHAKGRTRFANYIGQVASLLCEHAVDLGWLQINPVKGLRHLKTPQDRTRPHEPWPDWAVARFRESASPEARLAFEIGIGSVQRPADWTKFRWSDFDGAALHVRQNKTGKELVIPCTAALRAALEGAPKRGLTILAREHGRPHDYFSLARMMHKERDRLGLLAYDLHALRYLGVMDLAWAGCDDEEIAAISGQSLRMVKKYAGKARQIMRARQASAKRDLLKRTDNEP